MTVAIEPEGNRRSTLSGPGHFCMWQPTVAIIVVAVELIAPPSKRIPRPALCGMRCAYWAGAGGGFFCNYSMAEWPYSRFVFAIQSSIFV